MARRKGHQRLRRRDARGSRPRGFRTRPARRPRRVEHGDTLDIRALHEIKIPQLLKIAKRPRGRERDRDAQAGPDLQDPAGADREEGADLLRGRARVPARRLRLPARARVQLPAGPGRHLRLALADPQVRPAHRRHGLGPDPAAQGRGALLRPDQGRGGQLRAPRRRAREDLLRQPDAALPAGPHPARDPDEHDLARARPRRARSARASAA